MITDKEGNILSSILCLLDGFDFHSFCLSCRENVCNIVHNYKKINKINILYNKSTIRIRRNEEEFANLEYDENERRYFRKTKF